MSAGHLRQTVNTISMARRGQAGELRIGLMASLSSGFLADLLRAYRYRFPSIDITIEEATAQSNAAAILNGRMDVAFIPGAPQLPGCRAKPLWGERIFVAVPCCHPVALKEALIWDDIKKDKFLVTADGAGPEIENFLVRRLSGHGFRPQISVQRVGRENVLNLVAGGFGITLTTSSTLGTVYPGISFLPVGGSEDIVISSVVWSDSNRNPALKFLLEMSLDHARRTGRASERK